MYKIFILTEGGGHIGMGHVSRCLSIYQAFEKRGYSPEFIINANTSITPALEGVRYHLFDWISDESKTMKLIKNANIVLVDSYKCPSSLYQQIASVCGKAVFIDDNVRLVYPPGVVVNGVMGAEKMNYPERNDIDYLLGAQYVFLRSVFWDVHPRIINQEVKSVMVSCGGNDDGLSTRIIKILLQHFPSMKISVVLKDTVSSDIEYLSKNADVFTDLSADKMKTLMSKSDITITAAGQTSYELCRMGTPFIALLTADNQAYSIGNFFIQGLVQEAIKPNSARFEKLLISQVTYLLDKDIRKKISEKMQASIDGCGSLKLVDYLIKHTSLN